MRPPGSVGGHPPPQGEVLYSTVAWGGFSSTLAPVSVGPISLPLREIPPNIRYPRHHKLALMRPPGSVGVHPPLRERFFTALLRGKFFSSLLAPIFMGAIFSPLRGSPPNIRHCCRHNSAPMRPPGSAGGHSPSERGFSCRTAAWGFIFPSLGARLCGRHLLATLQGVRRPVIIIAAPERLPLPPS